MGTNSHRHRRCSGSCGVSAASGACGARCPRGALGTPVHRALAAPWRFPESSPPCSSPGRILRRQSETVSRPGVRRHWNACHTSRGLPRATCTAGSPRWAWRWEEPGQPSHGASYGGLTEEKTHTLTSGHMDVISVDSAALKPSCTSEHPWSLQDLSPGAGPFCGRLLPFAWLTPPSAHPVLSSASQTATPSPSIAPPLLPLLSLIRTHCAVPSVFTAPRALPLRWEPLMLLQAPEPQLQPLPGQRANSSRFHV